MKEHWDEAYDLGYKDALKEMILFITELMGSVHGNELQNKE